MAFPGAALLVALAVSAGAHPHSYVEQQALLSIGRDSADLTILIVPSSAEGAAIHAHLDRDGDGNVDRAEARAFGEAVVAASNLLVNGRRATFAFIEATVPDAASFSQGRAMLSVKARAHVSLSTGQDNDLIFTVTYDDLSHDWQVQPFFHADLLAATSSRSVGREGGANSVNIRLGAHRP